MKRKTMENINLFGVRVRPGPEQQLRELQLGPGHGEVEGRGLGVPVAGVGVAVRHPHQLPRKPQVAVTNREVQQRVVLLLDVLLVDIHATFVEKIHEHPGMRTLISTQTMNDVSIYLRFPSL